MNGGGPDGAEADAEPHGDLGARSATPSPSPGAPPAGRRGRRPGSGDTRGRVLESARAIFAERGFDGTTIRDVAARAEVDPALVHHYFGTKQRLFVAAMEFPIEIGAVIPAIAAGPPERIGDRIIAAFVGLWDRPEVRPTLLGVARSATTDSVAAAMFRGVLVDGPLQAIAGLLGTPDAPMRATLVGSQLIGLAMVRYVAELEPIASMRPDELATLMGPTLTRYLLGDLGRLGGPEAGAGSFGSPGPAPTGPVR
ncbi:MAG: TetR/AcrR family transcriptional regulator [Candidatus Limnocylindrales bacterium]